MFYKKMREKIIIQDASSLDNMILAPKTKLFSIIVNNENDATSQINLNKTTATILIATLNEWLESDIDNSHD